MCIRDSSGAGGIIGTDHVAKSTPDGHTLLLTVPGPVTANIVLYGKLPYDPRTDLRMVSDIATTRTVLAVHPSVPAKDVASLIAVLGAAGLAVGLALQGTLQNIAAGIMLLILRPIRAGEYVALSSGAEGTVAEVGLFLTRLIQGDGIHLTLPNSTVWNLSLIHI